MPTVFISPEAFLHQPEASYARRLTDAGFDIRYPKNPIFTRGLGPEDETITELQDAVAVIAGGEYFTPRVLDACPKLRVIARAGVGFDRVNVPAATVRPRIGAVNFCDQKPARNVRSFSATLFVTPSNNASINSATAS